MEDKTKAQTKLMHNIKHNLIQFIVNAFVFYAVLLSLLYVSCYGIIINTQSCIGRCLWRQITIRLMDKQDQTL